MSLGTTGIGNNVSLSSWATSPHISTEKSSEATRFDMISTESTTEMANTVSLQDENEGATREVTKLLIRNKTPSQVTATKSILEVTTKGFTTEPVEETTSGPDVTTQYGTPQQTKEETTPQTVDERESKTPATHKLSIIDTTTNPLPSQSTSFFIDIMALTSDIQINEKGSSKPFSSILSSTSKTASTEVTTQSGKSSSPTVHTTNQALSTSPIDNRTPTPSPSVKAPSEKAVGESSLSSTQPGAGVSLEPAEDLENIRQEVGRREGGFDWYYPSIESDLSDPLGLPAAYGEKSPGGFDRFYPLVEPDLSEPLGLPDDYYKESFNGDIPLNPSTSRNEADCYVYEETRIIMSSSEERDPWIRIEGVSSALKCGHECFEQGCDSFKFDDELNVCELY